jgi:hypothetical protein
MFIGLNVDYPLFLSDFIEIRIFSRQILEKYSNVKFDETPSVGSRVFRAD